MKTLQRHTVLSVLVRGVGVLVAFGAPIGSAAYVRGRGGLFTNCVGAEHRGASVFGAPTVCDSLALAVGFCLGLALAAIIVALLLMPLLRRLDGVR